MSADSSSSLQPILSTGVSAEDLLITLNMLIDDIAAGENNDATGLAGILPEHLESIQESLDQLVESLGPSAEGKPITQQQLTQVFAKLNTAQLNPLAKRLATAIQQAGMQGEPSPSPSALAAASTSNTSTRPSGTAGKKSSSSSSSSSIGGGGLDLSISGFSIKPPAGFQAAKK